MLLPKLPFNINSNFPALMTCNITLATKASFYSLAMLSHLIGL